MFVITIEKLTKNAAICAKIRCTIEYARGIGDSLFTARRNIRLLVLVDFKNRPVLPFRKVMHVLSCVVEEVRKLAGLDIQQSKILCFAQ